MKKKNKKGNMTNRFISTGLKKAVLFLFLVLFFTPIVKSQCQIIDSVIVKNIDCYGANDGAIDLVLLHPLSNYSFFWNNLVITEDITMLSPGTYSVTITNLDTPTCIQDTSFTITQPMNPLTSTVNLYQDVDCFGDSTGVAYANAIGGTLPYTYLWDNGQTTQMANGLWGDTSGPGVPFTHTVTITDSLGCIIIDDIDIVNLHPEITGTYTVLNHVSCFGECDATTVLSSSGGVLQHTYFWDIGQTYIGSGPDTAFNLCYGGHDIIIEDALGCRKTVSFIISEPDELFAQAIQVQPVQCYGFDDGISFATATGGTTPYSFVWDDPVNGPTGQDIDSLTPGIHTIYVTDANGCTASDTVVITEPTQLEVIINDTMTVYSYCAGTNSGQLCAYVTGGTPTYNYLWNDALYQDSSCATNLIGQYNDYTVIVMDDRNCIATASFQLDSITNSMNPDSVIVDINNVSCFGIYNGSIQVSNVVGAVAPFTYTWIGPGTYTGTGDYISSLYAGNYAVIIEDSNDCAITINAVVDEPDQLEYTTYNVISETCYGANDGQIWVNVSGGIGDYYYDFSELGNFPIANADQVQLINDSLILNLSEGIHNIYITDDNNCEGAVVWGGNWVEKVDSGVVVSLTGVATTDATCFNTNDGQAWIIWPGADPLFNYTWETDPIGTVIDTGISTSVLSPGNYNLVVHYADSASFGQNYVGCDLVEPFTIGGPIPLVSGYSITDESCYGEDDGAISLSPSSSAPGIPTVLWDTTTSNPGSSTAANISSLQPGIYTATITDANGCQITEDYTVSEAEAITANIVSTAPSCNGFADGSAVLTVAGGTGSPYPTITWTPSGESGLNPIALAEGLNTVLIVDANNCSTSVDVFIDQPDPLIAGVESSSDYHGYDISCNGGNDGSAIVTTLGGVAPYTFLWTPSGEIGDSAIGLEAGTHNVEVTDANGCQDDMNIDLTEPLSLDPNLVASNYSTSANGEDNNIECYGWSNGWLESRTLGGVATGYEPFEYIWINDNNPTDPLTGSSPNIIENLYANTSYSVTITDANDCISTATSIVFNEPAPFIPDVNTTNYAGPTHVPFVVNWVDNTNSIDGDPFSFIWTWGEGETELFGNGTLLMTHPYNIEDIGENNVNVVVTNDSTGCNETLHFIIEAQGIPEISNVFTPNGDLNNDVFSFGEYGMKEIDIQIFNRWGQLVHSFVGVNYPGWHGIGIDKKEVPEGVYFYVLKADGEDGHFYENKGSITLLR